MLQVIYSQDFDITEELSCKEAGAHRHLFNPMIRSSVLTDNYDLTYCRFEWDLDPNVRAIRGTVTPYFKVVKADFNEINFDFAKELMIDSIIFHGKRVTYSQIGDFQLNIILPATIPLNSWDSISISYHGEPPNTGFGSFEKNTQNGSPILWTLSEPYGSQDWWPCKKDVNDKIDSIDILIKTDKAYRAASIGLLVNEKSLDDGRILYHWKHRYPITTYLVAFCVTPYVQFTHNVLLKDGTNMPMLNYVYKQDSVAAFGNTLANVKALQYYDSLFVGYPFSNEKYGHAQWGWGGGEEHQTMSFVGSFDWGLLAHELAHQWFGDYVTCGSFEDIWLNEGFATYLEGLTRERFQPNNWRSWKSGKINSITSNPNGSVKVPNIEDVNRIFSGRLTYNKGAYLLHMLRWKLGDQNFYLGIRNYLTEKAYNYAKTPDLQRHLEAASGQSLAEFLKDWYEGQGYPTYNVTWDQNGDEFLITLEQTQSNSSVSFFEMPVPITVKGEGKEITLRLDHTFSGQLFTSTPGFKVETVLFDPELWLVSKSSVIKGELSATQQYNSTGYIVTPNPATDVVTISSVSSTGSEIQYQILDMQGNVAQRGHFLSPTASISIAQLPMGVYILHLSNAKNKISSIRIVKM